MRTAIFVGSIVAAMCASVANAGAITEVEPNNSIATAQFIGPENYPANAFAFDGFLTTGDVDYISLTFAQPVSLTALTVSVPTAFADVDTRIGVFNSVGTLIIDDNDSGLGSFSLLQVQLEAGTYYIAVTGGPDTTFSGDHGVTGGYKLIVGFNVIPAPSALALLGVAGLVGRRRRRR